jgi:predicted type IV restriction endonuclease
MGEGVQIRARTPRPENAMPIPKKVSDRLTAGLKRFKPVLEAAKDRDVNESDTSMIVTDMLAEVFGFDKYAEVTREYAIRGTFCDLATKIEGQLQTLIEVKAIGLGLRENHIKQAVDYAANQGVEWVILTNGQHWKVFSVSFSKPISADLVLDLDILEMSPSDEDAVEDLFLLSKEGIQRSGLDAYNDQLKVRNKFNLAALILSDPILHTIRRELKRISPDVRISVEEIKAALSHEVIKRDAIEGDAQRLVSRAASKALRQRKAKESGDSDEETVIVESSSAVADGGQA